MDRYYSCSVTGKDIVECVPITIDHVLVLDPKMVHTIDKDFPKCLDIFLLMRKFEMPVKVVQVQNP